MRSSFKFGYRALMIFLFICFLSLPAESSADQVYHSIEPNADSWIASAQPDINYGLNKFLAVRSGNNYRRLLIGFDLSSVPASATLESARLDLYLGFAPGAPRIYGLHRLSNSWLEGGGDGVVNDPAVNGVTWYERQYGDNLWDGSGLYDWQTAGGEFISVSDTATVPDTSGSWVTWNDILGDVNQWYGDPSSNYGWLIMDEDEAGDRNNARFSSVEDNNPSLWPKLVLSYVKAEDSIAPPVIGVGGVTTMTVTLVNKGGTYGDHINEINVNIPAGFTHIPMTAASYAITPPPGKSWSVKTLPLTGDGPQIAVISADTPADEIMSSETINLDFPVMAPWSIGNYFWTTDAVGAGGGIHRNATETISTIGGSLFMLTGGDQSMTSITLSGIDQTDGGSLGIMSVRDGRGTGEGWNVIISGTDFISGGPSTRTISAAGFNIPSSPPVTTIDGNAPPVSYSGMLAVPGFKILSASSGTGMGDYRISPGISLNVPAETFVGTYASEVVVTIQSGP